jgi:hypothetical protein
MTSLTTDFKEIVDALQADNKELRKIITEQDAKLERAIFAIHQLHGGLYNQGNQSYILDLSLALLHGEELPIQSVEPYNQWPTTRQGDEHEERILKLEKTLELLQQQIFRLGGEKTN